MTKLGQICRINNFSTYFYYLSCVLQYLLVCSIRNKYLILLTYFRMLSSAD